MSDEQTPDSEEDPQPEPEEGPQTQEIRHSQVSAIVPERVARGVFSTGAVVVQGAHEFIVDFLLRMNSPQQLAARVVLPPAVMAKLIAALGENLKNYEGKFGPPTVPSPPGQQEKKQGQQTSAEELYEQLKIPDDVMSGNYANAVMIGHSGSEFSFDFITTFFPRSAVSCRVFLSAPNVPRFLDSLKHSFEKYQNRQTPPNPNEPPAAADS